MAKPSFDVTLKGMALVDQGLTDWNVYDALGLLSLGLVWTGHNIWYGPVNSNGATSISTTWTLAAGSSISTTWSLYAGASITTSWTIFSTYNIEDI